MNDLMQNVKVSAIKIDPLNFLSFDRVCVPDCLRPTILHIKGQVSTQHFHSELHMWCFFRVDEVMLAHWQGGFLEISGVKSR